MAKLGEINYLRNVGEGGRRHAVNKPFSDGNCPKYLVELGAIFTLLPPPPLRLLDIGCGPGWTSRFFARRGYEVLGIDICTDMIEIGRELNEREGLEHLQFQVSDYETFETQGDFDIAVFFDSLHHAVNEEAALRMAYEALKPGGVCITSEPGRGHSQSAKSQSAIARFDVTEKDMPPARIITLGRKVGFRTFQIFPHAFEMNQVTYVPTGRLLSLIPKWLKPLRKLVALLKLNRAYLMSPRESGIVLLRK